MKLGLRGSNKVISMSYMRQPAYIWSDGYNIHIHYKDMDLSIPSKMMDELAVMLYAEMTVKQRKQAEKRAMKNHGGNFGCDPLLKKHKKETTMDYLKGLAKTRKVEKCHS